VSDDMTTLSQPVVSVYEARGFIPFSIRVGMDYQGFAEQMAMLLGQGYIDSVASVSVTGSGTNQPTGIFTGIDAVSASEVVTTTDGRFGAVDVRKVWSALPERFRSRASWLMSVTVANQIRAFGLVRGRRRLHRHDDRRRHREAVQPGRAHHGLRPGLQLHDGRGEPPRRRRLPALTSGRSGPA